jgi:ABC-type glycerol-3-phosphate transport system substrate-binding protein
MIKKISAFASSAVLALTALTGCATLPEPSIELTLLTYNSPDSLANFYEGYQQIADDYRRVNPEVRVTIRSEEESAYGSVLETGFAGGTAPDILHLKSGQRLTYAPNLIDLRDYFGETSPYADDQKWIDTFVGGEGAFPVEDNGVNANSLLFVPNDGNPEVFAGRMYIFNKKLVKDAGLDPDATPKDFKEFFEWMVELDKSSDVAPIAGSSDVGGKVSQIGYGFGEKYADNFFDSELTDTELSGDLFYDKIYALTSYDGGSEMALADLPYYPGMFTLIKQHLSYFQDSWTENTAETEILTFASGKAALMQTSFWDYGSLVGVLSESAFPEGYSTFQMPYFGADTLSYAVEQGWVSQEEADAAQPYVVTRPLAASGAGRHDYGFSLNNSLEADPEKLAAAVDFLKYLSSPEAQAKYVETAQSFSPVVGVPLVDSLSSFVVPEPEGGFAEQVLGYTVIEWGKAGWDVLFTQYLSGAITWQELVNQVAFPEWAADIPAPDGLATTVSEAKAAFDAAAEEDKEGTQRALTYAELREKLYNTYYHNKTGDLVELK